MKRIVLSLGLMLAAAGTANAQSVEIGTGDWSSVPVIQPRGKVRMTEEIVERLHKVAAETKCNVSGFTARRIDLAVPFVIQFTPEGGIGRIVLRNMRCPQLESVLGGVLLQMAEAGEYRPTGENPERWYRSELTFLSR